jgi:hypothetical protein
MTGLEGQSNPQKQEMDRRPAGKSRSLSNKLNA